MALFGFGAFSTPVGQLIERATDNAASAGNIALHLQICDVVNGTENGAKEAVAAIRKRLTGSTKNFHIINLTLTVLETCVKNCSMKFHVKVAQKDFLQDLMKVISTKNNPPTIVRDKILGLIQYWAEAFKDKPQLSAMVEQYQQLKDEGVDFPPIDLDTLAPVETPERSVPEGQAASSQPQPQQEHRHRRVRRGPIGPLSPEQTAKLMSELDVVRANVDVANEIMTENEPGTDNDDTQLLKELNLVLHNMQLRVTELIDRMQEGSILEALLTVNDDLHSVFVRFERYLKNSGVAASSSAGGAAPAVSTVGEATTSMNEPSKISYPKLDEDQLIDLGTEIEQPVPASGGSDIVAQLAELGISASGSQQHSAAADGTQTQDEFDMFAKSRTAYSSKQEKGSTYDDQQVKQEASLSDAVRGRTGQPQQPQEPMYSNIQDWLSGTDLEKPTEAIPADSATSAEFDQFLAQRVVKGEELPTSRPRHQMQQKLETKSDEMFTL